MKKEIKVLGSVLMLVACMGMTACGGNSGTDTPKQQGEQDSTNTATNEIEGEYTMEDADGVAWRLEITGTHFDLYGTKTNANNEEVEICYTGPVVTNEEGTDHTGKLKDPAYLFVLGGGRYNLTVNGETRTAGDELYDKLSGVLDADDFAKPKIQVNLDTDNHTFSLVNSEDTLHVGVYWE